MEADNSMKQKDVSQIEVKGYYLVMLLFMVLVGGLAAALSWVIQLEFDYIYHADFFSGVQPPFLLNSYVADVSIRLFK